MLRNIENKIEKLEKAFNLMDDELNLLFFLVDHENVHASKESMLKNCSEMEMAEEYKNGKLNIKILPCEDCKKSCLGLVNRSSILA